MLIEKKKIMLFFCSLFMKIHSVIPRKILKRSRDFVDGDELVNILTLNSNPTCWLVKSM